jgi:hypothetical protein
MSLSDNYKLAAAETTEEILRFTPQIYLREHKRTDGKNISPYASSILLEIGKQHFILTAGHVIAENDPEDLGIMIGNTFYILLGDVRYINPYLNEESNKLDIAVIKITGNLQLI